MSDTVPIHVLPEEDGIKHQLATNCICGPDGDWVDPGGAHPSGPLVTHHSLDGRRLGVYPGGGA